jgi:hypothetical protein
VACFVLNVAVEKFDTQIVMEPYECFVLLLDKAEKQNQIHTIILAFRGQLSTTYNSDNNHGVGAFFLNLKTLTCTMTYQNIMKILSLKLIVA